MTRMIFDISPIIIIPAGALLLAGLFLCFRFQRTHGGNSSAVLILLILHLSLLAAAVVFRKPILDLSRRMADPVVILALGLLITLRLYALHSPWISGKLRADDDPFWSRDLIFWAVLVAGGIILSLTPLWRRQARIFLVLLYALVGAAVLLNIIVALMYRSPWKSSGARFRWILGATGAGGLFVLYLKGTIPFFLPFYSLSMLLILISPPYFRSLRP